jgi:hypothetical protein
MGQRRGSGLLLDHCARLHRMTGAARPSAGTRLEKALGRRLTRVLIAGLAGDHRRRSPCYPWWPRQAPAPKSSTAK